jgi:hypothetical protein
MMISWVRYKVNSAIYYTTIECYMISIIYHQKVVQNYVQIKSSTGNASTACMSPY